MKYTILGLPFIIYEWFFDKKTRELILKHWQKRNI